MIVKVAPAALLAALGAACSDSEKAGVDGEPTPVDASADAPVESGQDAGDAAVTDPGVVTVTVRLDGEPIEGAVVVQGGNPMQWSTDADGRAVVVLDLSIEEVGELAVMAAHPEARTRGALVTGGANETVSIDLKRFSTQDNELYQFQDPGEPTRRGSSAECAHCHITINEDWFDSPHKTSANNPVVQDLYAGAAAAFSSQADCVAAGGNWWDGIAPGTGNTASRCYLGDGALPALNPTCGTSSSCDGVATAFGGCADCHAPGINGKLGGRDLLEATGHAYDYGVHCDVCHRVESVDMTADPGVAGRLHLIRPSEPPRSPTLGTYEPLTFGPWLDVANPRMGAVQRSLYADGTLCAGCHQHEQAVLVPGEAADPSRWPSGKLPVHTTYAEWEAGPLSSSPCPDCHMPADFESGNGADLYNFFSGPEGVAFGWARPPGSVRRHTWFGPRQPASGFLQNAANLSIQKEVQAGELTARVTVQNVGAGHALPTGEPLRSMVLLVEASCSGTPLAAVGGDAVPDFGGHFDRKVTGDDWSDWPGAKVGDLVRVVRRPGPWRDYQGFGPFGDGTFAASDKGMPEEQVAGQSTIASVAGSTVTFDAPLPAGDVAYRVSAASLPSDGAAASAWAGAPGFGFARVMVAADGRRMVPHFLAVDVASDNRILPQEAVTTEHRFASPCADPEVRAVLLHRAWPLVLATQRGWSLTESVMDEATQ